MPSPRISKPKPPLSPEATVIFTDGASSGNPGPSGWAAILVGSTQEVIELGGSERKATNNRMELLAVIEALQEIQQEPSNSELIQVYTDSLYVLKGITQWVWTWEKRNWISSTGNEISNLELWKTLLSLTRPLQIQWNYVPGHAGIPGNERADEIAVAFSLGKKPSLYRGTLDKYSIDVLEIPKDTSIPKTSFKNPSTKSKPYSYLSLVNQIPVRHSTWEDCEKRVKGQSGAKFKKALTSGEEEEILQGWGFSPEDLKKN